MLISVFGLAVLMSFGAAKNFMGPFDVIIKEPFFCEDEGTKEIYLNETIIRKTGRNSFKLSTKVFLAIDVSDDLQNKLNFAVWGNGGWRPNFLTLIGAGCSLFKDKVPDLFAHSTEAMNVPARCPLPKGNYKWVDINATPKIEMEHMPYNKYKITFEFFNGSVLVGCYGLVAQIVPKVTKKG